MDEKMAGRLELSVARAVALLGPAPSAESDAPRFESTQVVSSGPNAYDAALIAARISSHSAIPPDAAQVIANDIVNRARAAHARLAQTRSSADVSQDEALALESVMQVRGRPAVRVLANHLEPLKNHPGSEFWQEFIAALVRGTDRRRRRRDRCGNR